MINICGKSVVVAWKNLPLGSPESLQAFSRGAAPRERQPLRTLYVLSDFWIKTVKILRPRVALGFTLNIFGKTLGQV